MTKDLLLKLIAEKGYDVLYGAKRNFASYDILNDIPKYSSFVSLIFGVLGLVYPDFATQIISVIMLLIGIVGMYYDAKSSYLEHYKEVGIKTIQIYDELKLLYSSVSMPDFNENKIADALSQYRLLSYQYQEISNPDQLFLSDCYAHFKIFYQGQIQWLDKELNFKWWKDKVPGTMKFAIFTTVFVSISYIAYKCWPCIIKLIGTICVCK